ncbi:MAG: hypothetical protein APR63_04805 [Desulfuromonas sp. SDB]|nr:MAG: hypothetical protein APR63_04805 [Desulfuromonas sp. SDB]
MNIWGGIFMYLGTVIISLLDPEQTLNLIVHDYRRVEEAPRFTEGNFYWDDLIYLFPDSSVAELIIENITDTSRLSRASLTKGAHLAWAIYDGRAQLGDQRIGAWMGNLYVQPRDLMLTDRFPETTRWLLGMPGDFNLVGGCRWALFYVGLDSQGYHLINGIEGNLTINEIALGNNIPRAELAVWLVSLLRFDLIRLSEERISPGRNPAPLSLPQQDITGIGYFFIGE